MRAQRVLCTGPESSGTRLLTRLVSDLGFEAVHRSIPHGDKWWDDPGPVDRVLFISRDPFITEVSAIEAGHRDTCGWEGEDYNYPHRLVKAWQVFLDYVRESELPWIPLTYEGLIARPQWTMDNVALWLGVLPKELKEPVVDPRKDIF